MFKWMILASLVFGHVGFAQEALPFIPALLSGQSNAVMLSPFLPPGSHYLVAENSQSIGAWDPNAAPNTGHLGHDYVDALTRYNFGVIVWWQGESDARRPPEDYRAKLIDLLRLGGAPTRPVMIVEIANIPELGAIRAVHAELAQNPKVALIPTNDLHFIPDSVHLEPSDYPMVAMRLAYCYWTACWERQ